jgi:hypothetical protein
MPQNLDLLIRLECLANYLTDSVTIRIRIQFRYRCMYGTVLKWCRRQGCGAVGFLGGSGSGAGQNFHGSGAGSGAGSGSYFSVWGPSV